jgi:glutathione S-transferase
MIKFYQFRSLWDLPSFSPFSMKLDTYFRMAKIPYEPILVVDSRPAPKQKIPYITDGNVTMGDSGLIIDYLKQKYGDSLDKDLTSQQRSQALAFQRLLEEHFYWVMLCSRWNDPKFWPLTYDVLFSKLPFLKRCLISKKVKKHLMHEAYMQGVGRHTLDEIYKMGCDDITAVATALNEQKFFLGTNPTSIDACVYAFMAAILMAPYVSPLKIHAQKYENLVAYCERMKTMFYS